MFEAAAVDASPLIYLGRIDRIELLRILGARVVVPKPVFEELTSGNPPEPAVRTIEQAEWLSVVADEPVPDEMRAWDLDRGEAAVLAWAWAHPHTLVVIDDLAARRCASSLRMSMVGTLAVLLAAKRRRLIPAIRPVIEALLGHGMYLSEGIVRRILDLADEGPR